MKPLFFLGLFLSSLSAVSAQNEMIEQQIAALSRQFSEAVEKADFATLQKLQSPALVYVAANHAVMTRDEIFEAVRGDHGKWSLHNSRVKTCEIFGDTVISTGTEETRSETGASKGATSVRRFLNVWQRNGKSWIMISRNVTVISERPAKAGAEKSH